MAVKTGSRRIRPILLRNRGTNKGDGVTRSRILDNERSALHAPAVTLKEHDRENTMTSDGLIGWGTIRLASRALHFASAMNYLPSEVSHESSTSDTSSWTLNERCSVVL